MFIKSVRLNYIVRRFAEVTHNFDDWRRLKMTLENGFTIFNSFKKFY